MLFNTVANAAVAETFKQAQHQINTARKNEAVKRSAYYQSEQDDFTLENLAKWASEPDKLQPLQINIVRKIINNLAMVYFRPARRTIDGSKIDQSIFAGISKSAMLDASLKQASRYAKLHKTVLLRVVWRNGQIEVDTLTPDILDVTTGDSPRDLQSVMVTNYPASGKADEVTYSLWTADTFQRLDWRGEAIQAQDNPYKVLPFVACWDSLPLDDFWVKGGADIINAQDIINQKLTDLMYIIQSQAFAIGWIKSGNHGMPGTTYHESINVNPGSFVQLPSDGNSGIGFESPMAPIKETWEVIEALIKQVAIANGLSAHSITATPVNESGISKIIGNQELMEKRQDDIELWRRYEGQLFNLFKVVWNTHNPGKQISDKANQFVDFADLRDTNQELEESHKWQMLIDAGQASPIDWAIARNPDFSREQAREHLEMIRTESAEMSAANKKQPVFDFDK